MAPYHVDHVIGETDRTSRRPTTRAEQREATRIAIVQATAACLAEEGYAALTTRRVAERADVAQSTVMHHFETREALLVEAVTYLALRLSDRALESIDLAALGEPSHREAVLDEAWREFTSPQALAAAQLWMAAWSEPELAGPLRELDERIAAIIATTAQALFPDLAGEDDERLAALLDASISVIRGLLMALPIWGREAVDARWAAIKPILLDATAQLLDRR
jgi:AcrR family transcriptional regulator